MSSPIPTPYVLQAWWTSSTETEAASGCPPDSRRPPPAGGMTGFFASPRRRPFLPGPLSPPPLFPHPAALQWFERTERASFQQKKSHWPNKHITLSKPPLPPHHRRQNLTVHHSAGLHVLLGQLPEALGELPQLLQETQDPGLPPRPPTVRLTADQVMERARRRGADLDEVREQSLVIRKF